VIDLLLEQGADPAQDGALVRALAAHDAAARQSARRSDLRLVGEAERAVRADPARAFAFDSSGAATLAFAGRSWRAGRFQPTAVGDLRRRAVEDRRSNGARSARVRLWVIDGGSASTDIGSLQASAGDGALFQVASQFNCLESPGPWLNPVERYLGDSTQGPRASISALPGTLLRHYAAPGPDGQRFVQIDDGRQIELLADVCAPEVAAVRNGYLLVDDIVDPRSLRAVLETRFESIRIGVHDDVEVVLGYDWAGAVPAPGPRIAQVFTSTVAGGGYGTLSGPLVDVCRQLLRAAYLGTLLAAVTLHRPRVVLTLIGGGVFGNPLDVIWESILWALDEASPLASQDLEVLVNGRGLDRQLDLRRVGDDVRKRGGVVLAWPASGAPAIHR
jgi:hypothetical protein